MAIWLNVSPSRRKRCADTTRYRCRLRSGWSRHARRLNAASVFLALRRELVRRDKAQERADLAAARRTARESIEVKPGVRRRGAWPARRCD